MPNNPYEPNLISQDESEIASIKFAEIVRASMAQFGFLNAYVMLLFGYSTQWRLLEEFGIELSSFSLIIFKMIRYWPLVAVFLGCTGIVSLVYYWKLNGQPIRLAKQWWYFSIGFWLIMVVLLLTGATPPLYSVVTDLTAG